MTNIAFVICAQDVNGWTPLHLACMFGYYDDVRTLRELGADERALDNDQRTPADLAYFAGYRDIAEDIDPEQHKQDWQLNDFPFFVDMISSH